MCRRAQVTSHLLCIILKVGWGTRAAARRYLRPVNETESGWYVLQVPSYQKTHLKLPRHSLFCNHSPRSAGRTTRVNAQHPQDGGCFTRYEVPLEPAAMKSDDEIQISHLQMPHFHTAAEDRLCISSWCQDCVCGGKGGGLRKWSSIRVVSKHIEVIQRSHLQEITFAVIDK